MSVVVVVCGTDFSEPARAAQVAAAALASGDGKLWLVHVLDPALVSLLPEATDAVEASRRRLEDEAAALRGRTRADVEAVVLAGAVSETLVEFAAANHASLLVVGAQGRGASSLVRLGSTSERLAQASPVPVLVVRDPAPWAALHERQRRLRVLLAVDWTRSSDPPIRWVKALRRLVPCDVVVGHVYSVGAAGEGSERYGLAPSYPLLEPDAEVERLLTRDLALRVGDLEGEGEVTYRPFLGLGRVGDHVLELGEQEAVDLIALGTHHRRGLARLGSVASVTLHFGSVSVVVAPLPFGEVVAPDEVPAIRRVLVATDLSPLSNAAVPFAYALVGDRGGEVYLMHAQEPKEPVADSEMAARLRSLVPRRGVPKGVATRTEVVVHVSPATAICEAAERLAVDAVCIGSSGRSGIVRAVLGSVADAVLRESRRPVVVVRTLPP